MRDLDLQFPHIKRWMPLVAAVACFSACDGLHSLTPSPVASHESVRMKADGIVTGQKYTYHGCVVYGGSGGSPDPFANADIANATVDPNSAAVIAAQNSNFAFTKSSDAFLEIVNIASSTTPVYTVHTNGGHSGPLSLPAPTGYTAAGPVPWQPGPVPSPFLFEGTVAGNCSGDCHWTTLDTSDCYVFEGGGGTFQSGTTFKTYNGFIDDLGASYASQWKNKSDNWSVAGIPGLGFTDYGEDFLHPSQPINHPLQIIVRPVTVQDVNVNLSPGPGGDGSCTGGSSRCLDYGDILRLKSSVTCPKSVKAALVCNQLKTYGAVVSDTEGSSTTTDFRFGLDTSGKDDTNAKIFTFLNARALADFDIITRGALVP